MYGLPSLYFRDLLFLSVVSQKRMPYVLVSQLPNFPDGETLLNLLELVTEHALSYGLRCGLG
jgi:hypothetical protein